MMWYDNIPSEEGTLCAVSDISAQDAIEKSKDISSLKLWIRGVVFIDGEMMFYSNGSMWDFCEPIPDKEN